jgi:hypothetical protein
MQEFKQSYHRNVMPFPIRTCVNCSEEFELKPDKPGFANRCPSCSEPDENDSSTSTAAEVVDRQSASEMNAERRKAIRDMLYRKDS